MTDRADPPRDLSAAGAPAILDALAEEAEALRRSGRGEAAEMLLALRRLHAARIADHDPDASA